MGSFSFSHNHLVWICRSGGEMDKENKNGEDTQVGETEGQGKVKVKDGVCLGVEIG